MPLYCRECGCLWHQKVGILLQYFQLSLPQPCSVANGKFLAKISAFISSDYFMIMLYFLSCYVTGGVVVLFKSSGRFFIWFIEPFVKGVHFLCTKLQRRVLFCFSPQSRELLWGNLLPQVNFCNITQFINIAQLWRCEVGCPIRMLRRETECVCACVYF